MISNAGWPTSWGPRSNRKGGDCRREGSGVVRRHPPRPCGHPDRVRTPAFRFDPPRRQGRGCSVLAHEFAPGSRQSDRPTRATAGSCVKTRRVGENSDDRTACNREGEPCSLRCYCWWVWCCSQRAISSPAEVRITARAPAPGQGCRGPSVRSWAAPVPSSESLAKPLARLLFRAHSRNHVDTQ